MEYFYMDKFRGFHDALIQLRQANFLVGENSTGKSSFLSAIKILNDCYNGASSSDYFNNNDLSLGSFSDVFSPLGSNSTRRFVLATISCSSELENYAFAVRFSERERSAQLTRAIIVDNTKMIIFDSTQDNSYKVFSKNIKSKDEKSFVQFFRKTVLKELTQQNPPEYKEHPIRIGGTFPFGRFTAYGMQEVQKNKTEWVRSKTKPSVLKGQRINWIAPIRQKPQRYYDAFKLDRTSEGAHIPYLLKQLLDSYNEKDILLVAQINKFGRESGLFDKIEPDEYSRRRDAPFQLKIRLNNNSHKISNVGYGVSQVLPVIVDSIISKESVFSIQQPEVHLHPRAQAALGDFIYSLVRSHGKTMFIETHSDFAIDRFRVATAKEKEETPLAQVLFFERGKKHNNISSIFVEKDGSYSSSQPDSFRDFFMNEQLQIMKI